MSVTARSQFLICSTIFLLGCTKDDPFPDKKPDAGTTELLVPPTVESWPSETPLLTVAARGTTDGDRVAVLGGTSGMILAQVLPNGSFCQDIPIADGESSQIEFYALRNGEISNSIKLNVKNDPEAIRPANATCSGSVDQCTPGMPEVCGNDVNDDCDNTGPDNCDTDCNGCEDDVWEPNDLPSLAPELDNGTYEMKICPCRPDYFAFNLNPSSGTMTVSAQMNTHDNFDLDMILFSKDGGEAAPIARATSTDPMDALTAPSLTAGTYYLKVFRYGTSDINNVGYALTVQAY